MGLSTCLCAAPCVLRRRLGSKQLLQTIFVMLTGSSDSPLGRRWFHMLHSQQARIADSTLCCRFSARGRSRPPRCGLAARASAMPVKKGVLLRSRIVPRVMGTAIPRISPRFASGGGVRRKIARLRHSSRRNGIVFDRPPQSDSRMLGDQRTAWTMCARTKAGFVLRERRPLRLARGGPINVVSVGGIRGVGQGGLSRSRSRATRSS